MDARQFTKKSDGWYQGCGCGMKPQDKITPPPDSVEVFVAHDGQLVGPVTGINYYFVQNTTSIDVDPRDAGEWRKQGIARDAIPGFKGRLARG